MAGKSARQDRKTRLRACFFHSAFAGAGKEKSSGGFGAKMLLLLQGRLVPCAHSYCLLLQPALLVPQIISPDTKQSGQGTLGKC